MNNLDQLRETCENAYEAHKHDLRIVPETHKFSRCTAGLPSGQPCEPCRAAQKSHRTYCRTEAALEEEQKREKNKTNAAKHQ